MTDPRIWRYRPGEARIFDSLADVPENEGWGAFPVPEAPLDVPEVVLTPPGPDQELSDQDESERARKWTLLTAAAIAGQRLAEESPNAAIRDAIRSALGGVPRAVLRACASQLGIEFDSTWTRAQVRSAIEGALDGDSS